LFYKVFIFCLNDKTGGNSPSVSQSLTLDRKDKVKHYIKIKTHNNIDHDYNPYKYNLQF